MYGVVLILLLMDLNATLHRVMSANQAIYHSNLFVLCSFAIEKGFKLLRSKHFPISHILYSLIVKLEVSLVDT